MVLSTDAYSNSGAQVEAKNKDFSIVSQTELTRSLVPFVAQVANCCLRPSFWFSCTLVPCDCFCGAGYWSKPSSPPLPADVSLSADLDGYRSHRVGSRDNPTFQRLFALSLPRESRITICARRKEEINASETKTRQPEAKSSLSYYKREF